MGHDSSAAHGRPTTSDTGGRRARFTLPDLPAPAALPHEPRLLAGAAEVDITPPPGMPKAGYSSNAHDGRGFRTRLRARVLHLRCGGASVAIVQCDLLGGSSVLQHQVARAVAETTDVPFAGLMIGATHTHAGPGQFLGTDFYNRFASNRPGFDPGFTGWLVERIASAVEDAVRRRVPARMAVGSVPVWGRTRNRSHDPHIQNEDLEDRRGDPQRKWVAVNPDLEMIRVDSAEGVPLAASIVFSVHGTGIPQQALEYNADLWAYVVHELASRIEETSGHRPVVGAMEGTHADVAPALRPGAAGDVEAERIGRSVGADAADLWSALGDDLGEEVALGAAVRELDLRRPEGRTIDGIRLADRPAVGAALVAGAKENLTPVIHRIPPFRAGTPKQGRDDDPQGTKWVLGSRWLQPLVLPPRGFPTVLPVQLLRLGPTALLGLPFEVTVQAGRRIAAEVLAAEGVSGSGVEKVVVSSVANEYSGYCTTPEEYRRQFYEGGHTLYGPSTQPFLAAHSAKLATDAAQAWAEGSPVLSEPVRARAFDMAVARRWLGPGPAGDVADVAGRPARRFVGSATFSDPGTRQDGWWEQEWIDVGPERLRWHEPIATVEVDDGTGWRPAVDPEGRRVDDGSCAIEVVHLGEDRYRVRWYRPVLRPDLVHRFVLLANAGRPRIESAPFD